MSTLEARLTPQQIVELDLDSPERLVVWSNTSSHKKGWIGLNEPGPEGDGSRTPAFNIDSSGLLSISEEFAYAYDLRNGSFAEGWKKLLGASRKTESPEHDCKCDRCGIKAMCVLSTSNGHSGNWKVDHTEDFLCQVAHLRAKMLGLTVFPHGECEYCRDGKWYKQIDIWASELRFRLKKQYGQYMLRKTSAAQLPQRRRTRTR